MNFIRQLIVMLLMLCILFITACPSEKGIRKAAKASLTLSDLTRDAIGATRKAYEGRLINLETKDKMAIALDKVIAGGETFNAAVKKLNEQYTDPSQVPPTALQELNALLSKEVATPFLQFLQLAGAVSNEQAPYLWAAINALRSALLLIGSFVSQRTVDMLSNDLDNRAALGLGWRAHQWQTLT